MGRFVGRFIKRAVSIGLLLAAVHSIVTNQYDWLAFPCQILGAAWWWEMANDV